MADALFDDLQTSTRPILPQLVAYYKKQTENKKNSSDVNFLFDYAWLALTEPDAFPCQPALVQSQGLAYVANFLVAKAANCTTLPTDVEDFFVAWNASLDHGGGGETDAQALSDAVWTRLAELFAANKSAVSVAQWILTAHKSVGSLLGRLNFFPFAGLLASAGVDTRQYLQSLPPGRYPPNLRHPLLPVSVQREIVEATQSGRRENHAIVETVFQLTRLFISCQGPFVSGKESLVRWSQQHVAANWSRGQLQVDPLRVCSDQLAWQVQSLWLAFCRPFLQQDGKFALLAPTYHAQVEELRAKLHDSTRLLDVKDMSTLSPQENSFVQHCFWLTALALQQGAGLLQRTWQSMMREMAELSAVHNGPEDARNRLWDERWALDFYLLDEDYVGAVLDYWHFASRYLVHLARSDHASAQVYEFLLELMLDSLTFFAQNGQHPVVKEHLGRQSNLPRFLLSLLANDPTILLPTSSSLLPWTRNPYLQSKVLAILPAWEWDVYRDDIHTLLEALIRFYVQVESLESSTGFYDKFNMRHQMADLILRLWQWDASLCQRTVEAIAHRQSSDVMSPFVRFVHLCLGDVTFLLDESFSKLQELHKTNEAIQSLEQQRSHQMLERQCRSLLQLANVSTDLLDVLTRHLPSAFSRPEIVPRLAGMLNLSTLQLAGPQCRQLKVPGAAERFDFRPRELLCKLANVCVNMRGEAAFVKALTSDPRAFRPAVLRRVVALTGGSGSPLESFVNSLDDMSSVQPVDEEEEEVPEEFLDQLMFTVMDDPVRLPSSGVVLDRATIVNHLLNVQTDPFNRSPLTLEQVIPLPDLKARIQAWQQK